MKVVQKKNVEVKLIILKNCVFERVRNLIRMVDNYMLDVHQDTEETPVKVLNSLSNWDGSSLSGLMWDESIENNAKEVVKKIWQGANNKVNDSHSQNQPESSVSSLIAVDLTDYLKLINEIPSFKNISGSNVNKSKDEEIVSSTPVIHKNSDLERS